MIFATYPYKVKNYQMKRVVDWLSLLFVSVGAMIGSGWMLGPMHAVKIAGVMAIGSWIIGGLMVMVIALVFAELSTMLPVTGGVARYPQFSHGGFVSFVMTWIAWVAYILLPPVEVQALLEYCANYYPALVTETGNGSVHLSGVGILAAAFLLILMGFINILGIKFATSFNKYLVYLKLSVPFIVGVVLLNTSFHVENLTSVSDVSLTDNFKNLLKSLPLAGVIFSYFGFRHSAEIGGEVRNPQFTLPISLIGSVLICMVIYTLVQTAFIMSMPPELVANGWHNFSFGNANIGFGVNHGPFVSLAALLGLSFLVKLILFDAVVAPFGSALMVVTTNARLDYAMSVNGYFPKFLMRVNRKQVPYWALIINLTFGLLLLLPFPGWQQMVSFVIAALVVSHAIAPISLYALRQQVPDQKRPFKLPCYKVMCRVVFILLNFIAYWTSWKVLSMMYLVLAFGLVYLYIFRLTHNSKHELPFLNFSKSAWLWCYLIGLALISYCGDEAFGGQGYLWFGLDLLAIAIFSLFIFEWSVKKSLTSEHAALQIMKENEVKQAYYNNATDTLV
jgi:amino acid transporter